MGSSNRHWPSLFKSKPQHHLHHDINSSPLISSSACRVSPYSPSSAAGYEERSPEPKPRWNPKPEQIRILEAIFNSGMVNPPRDEIRKIRAQLQEYGQVGDANVFYWFQNRKSRSKNKQRHQQLQATTARAATSQLTNPPVPPPSTSTTTAVAPTIVPSSPSSSSSDKGSSSDHVKSRKGTVSYADVSNSPTASVNNQTYFQTINQFIQEPLFFPVLQQTGCGGGGAAGFSTAQGLCFNDMNMMSNNGVVYHDIDSPHGDQKSSSAAAVGGFSSLLLGEMMAGRPAGGTSSKSVGEVDDGDVEKVLQYQEAAVLSSFFLANPAATNTSIASNSAVPPAASASSQIPLFQGPESSAGGSSSSCCCLGFVNVGPTPGKSTVFINDVAIEVPLVGPFNVRDAFGDDALLVHAGSGHPVLTDEWGVALQPLQNGAFYYLIRTLGLAGASSAAHAAHDPAAGGPFFEKHGDGDDYSSATSHGHDHLLASHFPYQI